MTVNAVGGAHHNPDVATSASGDAVVVWDEDTDGNGFYQIGLVKLAKANGTVALTRRSANSLGGGQQQRPAVAADFNGDFAVAWESDHTGTRGVWARSFTATGTAGSAEVEISSVAGAGNPTVGIDDQRDAVVGWSVAGTDPAVWARGLNPDGTFVVGAGPVRQSGHGRSAGAGRGGFLSVRRARDLVHRRQRRQHLRPGPAESGGDQLGLVTVG
ncbi:hypothetical protein ACFQ0T_04230 [Kitasatospora gansuensis]